MRIANGRMTLLTNDMVRLGVVLLEESPEGHLLRRWHDLALSNASLSLFPLAWTVMHEIDENSPLADYDAERFKGAARLFLTIEARDPVPRITPRERLRHLYIQREHVGEQNREGAGNVLDGI